jgi:hypothetical protein
LKFEISINKNSAKYIQGVNVSQLTFAYKTEIKNFCRATPDLVISQSSSSKTQTYVTKFKLAIYDKPVFLKEGSTEHRFRVSERNNGINTQQFLNTATNYKYVSKYRKNFCPTFGNTGI